MATANDDSCPGCGSILADREHYCARNGAGEELSTGFSKCPHCGADKCVMCNMGDDVECVSCAAGGGDDEDS